MVPAQQTNLPPCDQKPVIAGVKHLEMYLFFFYLLFFSFSICVLLTAVQTFTHTLAQIYTLKIYTSLQ